MSSLKKPRIQLLAIGWATLAILSATAEAQDLTLSVDPYSGAASIQNTTTGGPLTIDGYVINSASAQLLPDPTHTAGVGWDSLANAGLSGWQEVSPTANNLSELNLSSSSSIAIGGSLGLGHPFTPNGTEDLQWGYTSPGGIVISPAPLIFAGGLQVQVITRLGVGNSVVGTAAVLVNQESSPSFKIDGYVIQSPGGSLNAAGFSGYAGHNVTGWQSVAPSATALSELNLTSSSTLAPGHDQVLGSAFTAGSAQDLSLQFHLAGPSTSFANGTVLYKSVLNGDVTGDGIVNGLDINLIATNWLHQGTLPGDANYDGTVNGLDINLVATNWLHTLGGGGTSVAGVPEPSSLALLALGLVGACGLPKAVKRKSRGPSQAS